MRVKLMADLGGEWPAEGAEIDVPDWRARALIGAGFAVSADVPAPEETEET